MKLNLDMEEFFSSTFIILIFFPTFIINKKINLMAYIYIYHLFFWRKKGAYWFFWPLSVSWPQFSGAINWIPQSTSPIFPFLFYLIMKKRKKKKQLDAFRQWSHSLSTSGKAVRVPRGVPGHTRRPARLPDCGPSAVESLTLALLGPKPLFCPDGWFVLIF